MHTQDHLPLTFPQSGALIALGNADGTALRYEVSHLGRGKWRLEIDWNGKLADRREFTTQGAARSFARAHFRRRQIVKPI